MTFQDLILSLQGYWTQQGCVIQQPSAIAPAPAPLPVSSHHEAVHLQYHLRRAALRIIAICVIQGKLTDLSGKVDTCGVLYLHGLPGIFGGVTALFVAKEINGGAQLTGILVTLLLAGITGLLSGKIIALFGRRGAPYLDEEEFDAESVNAPNTMDFPETVPAHQAL